jgi:uncharacterized protein (DUF362 family)
MNSSVVSKKYTNYAVSVDCCMTLAGAAALLAEDRPVMLKPNLVNDSPHPVTTSPAFCEAVILFVREHTDAPVVVAEGCGDAGLNTQEVFERLGYHDLAQRLDVDLLDLNNAPLIRRMNPNCVLFPEMWLPEAAFDHLLISLPVLKAHSLCRFSGSMKNMMGLVPPRHYAGRFGNWKKAAFHHRLDQAIVDLNHYRCPDFTVMDASIGLADYHLGGAHCDPPVNRILAAADPRALDREAATLLGLDWTRVGHLA